MDKSASHKMYFVAVVCEQEIEEKIIQLQLRKKKLAEDLIGEEEGFVKSLTETDIEFLFS